MVTSFLKLIGRTAEKDHPVFDYRGTFDVVRANVWAMGLKPS